MNQSLTLTTFLKQTGARIRVFDMGRRVVKIPLADFERFEQCEVPYPYPLQRSAWLGILFWDPEQIDQQVVWFLRFPLDEQGLLVQSARDEFVAQLVGQVLEARQAKADETGFSALGEESPYAFKPKEERMAVFHARASAAAGQPPSRFYQHARDYLDGKPGWDQWAFLGMQGLADVTARLADNRDRIINALPYLPDEVLLPLCHCLENEVIDTGLTEALVARIEEELLSQSLNPIRVAALLRALSLAQARGLQSQLIQKVLGSALGKNIEILASIAGRGWEALEDEVLRLHYLECLADTPGGRDAFLAVITDLLFMPGMRPKLIESFRSPARSEKLAEAIGQLF